MPPKYPLAAGMKPLMYRFEAVTVNMGVNLSGGDIGVAEQSAASDHIDDTIHYGDVCEAVRQSLREQSFLLLEALAEHIAELILQNFGALWVRVRVVKPGILANVREVGVEIERRADADDE